MKIVESIDHVRQDFNDVTEYREWLQRPLDHSVFQSDSENAGHDSWAGGSLKDAFRMTREGWPEGLKAVRRFNAVINDRLVGHLRELEVQYDVTGDYIDMGRFMNGEPETFGAFVETEVPIENVTPKIVHIVANMSVSASISHTVIEMRGAALVSLIDALESHGKRVEVDFDCASQYIHTRVRVKEAHEALQLDKLAYLLIHPTALRRLYFRACEHTSNEMRRKAGARRNGSFSTPTDSPIDERGDIYMGSIRSGTDWSFDQALEWILATLEKFGVIVKPNEEERAALKRGVTV